LHRLLPVQLPADAAMDSSHTKTFILLAAHLSRMKLMTDYVTDQRSVLDQCTRILNAMLDIALLRKWLSTAVSVVILMQTLAQANWHTDHPLMVLPHFNEEIIERIGPDCTIPLLKDQFRLDGANVEQARKKAIKKILDAVDALLRWPVLQPKKFILHSESGSSYEVDYLQDERWPEYVQVEADASYRIVFSVEMIGPYKFETDAFCPRFHKERTAGWIVIVGEKDTGEALCCKKFPPVAGFRHLSIPFRIPKRLGRHIFTVFILSDSYLGVDQEYNLHCDIIAKTGANNGGKSLD
uniref:SEC63 domain-containing protein n=1 Tax=Gongylonema pulchrum TaxID=637853 RepID=A0A183CWD4_9BILA